jgi:hypothetical protein
MRSARDVCEIVDFTSAVGAEGWSFALTRGDANSSSTAIITGVSKLAIHTFFVVIVLFLSSLMFLLDLLCFASNPWRFTPGLNQLPSRPLPFP